MATLSDAVLPLIRTRADLHRWNTANAHGNQMNEAIDILEEEIPSVEPADAYSVAHKALASAIKVIARADDSSGIIGDACARLLALHPQLAAAAHTSANKLVPWMVTFQFDGEVDYFELDPVAYAPALGESGLQEYRTRLNEIRMSLGPQKDPDDWSAPDRHARWVLEWNDRRLAVLDRDINAIIRTHAKDHKVAAWLHDTAEAFEEVGHMELALDWAKQATDFGPGHQSQRAAEYWCTLVHQHRPEQHLDARHYVFRRWPTASNAAHLHASAGPAWGDYEDEVITALEETPTEAITFSLTTLKDPHRAWQLAHEIDLRSDQAWSELAKAYEVLNPVAVLPIHQRLVENTLSNTGASHYREAARRLARMRRLAADTEYADSVDVLITQLRETHRRRPRLQKEFDRENLPS